MRGLQLGKRNEELPNKGIGQTGPEGRSQTQWTGRVLSNRHRRHQPWTHCLTLAAHTVARTRYTGKVKFEGVMGDKFGLFLTPKSIFQPTDHADPIGHVAARVSTDTRPTGGMCKGRLRRRHCLLCWHLLSSRKLVLIYEYWHKVKKEKTQGQDSSTPARTK